jgi:hypothetical protein
LVGKVLLGLLSEDRIIGSGLDGVLPLPDAKGYYGNQNDTDKNLGVFEETPER